MARNSIKKQRAEHKLLRSYALRESTLIRLAKYVKRFNLPAANAAVDEILREKFDRLNIK